MTLSSRPCAAGRACVRNIAGPSRPSPRCYHVASASQTRADLSPDTFPPASTRGLQKQQTRFQYRMREADASSGFFTPSHRPQREQPPPFSIGPFGESEGANGPEPQQTRRDRRVSDHEYSVRVGHAFDLLRVTIPNFMRIGLVDHDVTPPSAASSSSGMTFMDAITFRALRARATAEDEARKQNAPLRKIMESQTPASPFGASSSAEDESSLDASPNRQIYHSSIQFRFCAGHRDDLAQPTSDLTDAEAASLSFSGRSLYFASAHVLRHTLNILFSDPQVELERIRLDKKGRGGVWTDTSSGKDHSSACPPSTETRGGDAIHMRVRFTGNLRVTGIEHQYTVVFRYDIDGETGRISKHTVERIEPAIGRKLWTVIATVWERITGQTRMPEPTPVPAPCTAHTEETDRRQGRLLLRRRRSDSSL